MSSSKTVARRDGIGVKRNHAPDSSSEMRKGQAEIARPRQRGFALTRLQHRIDEAAMPGPVGRAAWMTWGPGRPAGWWNGCQGVPGVWNREFGTWTTGLGVCQSKFSDCQSIFGSRKTRSGSRNLEISSRRKPSGRRPSIFGVRDFCGFRRPAGGYPGKRRVFFELFWITL